MKFKLSNRLTCVFMLAGLLSVGGSTVFAGGFLAVPSDDDHFPTMSPDEAMVGLNEISGAVPDDDENASSASPDGRAIVYEKPADDGDLGHNEIWVRDSETGSSRMLATGRMPVFSPDGSQIAFVTYDDSVDPQYDYTIIWTMSADGSNKTMVTEEGFGEMWHPQFSPDGSRLVFQCVTVDKEDFDLYVIGTDGRGLQQLTCNESYDGEPCWATDGIYFISDRGHEPGDYGRWFFQFDGGGQKSSPAIEPPSYDKGYTNYHVVKSGENIVRIAERYGVTVRNLVKWNNLQSMTLKPGMKIKVSE